MQVKDFRWEVTKACNMRCPHCYMNAEHQEKYTNNTEEITQDDVLQILPDLYELGIEKFSFTGGEPTLCINRFDKVAEELSKNRVYTRIFTNGTFNQDIIYMLKKLNIREIVFSIDGIRSTHDEFRNYHGAFDNAISNIRYAKKEGFVVAIRITLTSQNYAEIQDLFETYLLPLNPNKINIRPFTPVGRGKGNMQYTLKSGQYYTVMSYLIRLQKERYPITFLGNCYAFIFGGENRICSCGNTQMYMSYNGDIKPCGYIDISLGNIKKQRIKEIWMADHPVLNALRNKEKHDKCIKCEFWYKCLGGCKASSYAIYGNIKRTDPTCPMVW